MTAALVLLSIAFGVLAGAVAALVIQVKRKVQRAWRSLAFLDRCAEDVW